MSPKTTLLSKFKNAGLGLALRENGIGSLHENCFQQHKAFVELGCNFCPECGRRIETILPCKTCGREFTSAKAYKFHNEIHSMPHCRTKHCKRAMVMVGKVPISNNNIFKCEKHGLWVVSAMHGRVLKAFTSTLRVEDFQQEREPNEPKNA